MPSLKDLWPDKWLRAEHLQGKLPTVAIDVVAVESLYNPRTKKHEPKLIVAVFGKSLRLVCNKTQGHALADICRTEDYTPGWVTASSYPPGARPTAATPF